MIHSHIVAVNDGGSSKEIVMNVDEMHDIMRFMTTIEVSFHVDLAQKLKELSELKYYEGGEAQKTLDHYGKMLNKVNEIGDLYSRANSEVFKLVQHWIEQDRELAKSFYESLTPDSQLSKNLDRLSGGDNE
ncbi:MULTISPECIES: hypothetical protein [unclassified Granulicatella]|uniref:hypothetical protein n=1 Tax=unclassified Granulicatella TaxID=2630493 RepID=UPI001073FE69|nr:MULTISPECIES: hypothetical protein [unclassified Granulicatella]MBF0780474.1 hypothetical protein [Granulicatella sp. 19428wC4_WM01]TFU95373.1 hypothetical protein E4T68_05145 [Granulicatella sp. WM01]